MSVIDIQNIKISIASRNLLDIQNLQVQEGKRIGIVGKNGSGKSTLFRVLNGEIKADVSVFNVNGKVSLLPQLKRNDINKSGGEVTQEYFVKALEKSPKVLLADEPMTNLDASHIEWVEKKLKAFRGTLLLISHDRTLLDQVCDIIWELEDSQIIEYSGNYSAYVEQKNKERKHQQKEYEKFQQKKKQLEQAVVHKEQQAQRADKPNKKLTSSEARDATGVNPYFQTIQKGLHQNRKSLETRLEKLEVVEKPQDNESIKMLLPDQVSMHNKVIIRAEKHGGQVASKKLWNPTTFYIKGGDKIGIIGPNGSGKTTLVRQILNQSEENLYRSPSMKIGYFSQNLDVLDNGKTILGNVLDGTIQNETTVRLILAQLGFYKDDVYKAVKVLSGGEKVKVSLAKILVSDCNTLILDEPTNYLDVYALDALEELLKNYEGTVLFVTHDRHFVSEIADNILFFEDKQLNLFKGNYEAFLNRSQEETRDRSGESLMKVELSLANVTAELGKTNIDVAEKEELEKKFQNLIKEKRALKDK